MAEKIRVLVNGARGKMGSEAVRAVRGAEDMELVAETDVEDSLGEAIRDSGAQVVVDFTTPHCAFQNALAIVEAGAVRLRPIFLTAGTTMLGAWPITFDPIFSGLAWSIIFGLFVSTVFTLIVVPVVYGLLYRRRGTEEQEATP